MLAQFLMSPCSGSCLVYEAGWQTFPKGRDEPQPSYASSRLGYAILLRLSMFASN